ncbi:histidine kinase dimerization/phosphoacceptor domain-containing protein [Streptomyces indonesiensis]
MISQFRSRFRFRHLRRGLVGVALAVLVALEGLNAPHPAMAAATMVSGMLCLAALAVPERLFAGYAIGAAAVSCVLTVTEAQLSERPPNTPGMVELGALLLLTTRAVRRCPPLRAAGLVVVSSGAAVVLPLRIELWDDHLKELITVIAVCAVPFMVVGLCLRLYDTLREREREAIRQVQRLEHARELHDFVAHHVTAIVAQTKAARFTAAAGNPQSPEDLDRMLAQIERAGSQALGSMRAMVTSLRDHATASATTRPTGDPAGPRGLRGLRDLRALTEEFSEVGRPPS